MPRKRKRARVKPATAEHSPAAPPSTPQSPPIVVTTSPAASPGTPHLRAAFLAREEAYSGPLPHPDHLAKYEMISEGAANRILAMTEGQMAHRQAIEAKLVEVEAQRVPMGMVCGLLTSLGGLIVGGACILSGHDAAGGSVVASVMGGMVYVFVTGQRLPKEKPPAKP